MALPIHPIRSEDFNLNWSLNSNYKNEIIYLITFSYLTINETYFLPLIYSIKFAYLKDVIINFVHIIVPTDTFLVDAAVTQRAVNMLSAINLIAHNR